VKDVKGRIATLLHQELEALRFEEQLKDEERSRLQQEVYQEVKTRSNFYFSIDENKKSTNLRVYNKKAPGNHHRHPSIALPHEHVHVTHWLETEGLTEDKMFEIYGLYSHLIDLHIS